ncbi:DNA-3-methyladenine glycosylase [Paenisporosarcina sp. TG-14]|uniref:DNA-3-methyladenine glycosylase n=1 Tax=Paenisporosarcina sp. TG-14 TaxID=1231057 RepID=UPI0002FD1251|nr:DNA-3-methyladenine glycosylase [Paenisporosarcina sp. TG-14]
MNFQPISPEFFQQPTIELARNLVGQYLVHQHAEGLMVVKIIETEAYMGPEDRAAHSYGNRRTKRTEIMFGEAGLVYTYQMHTHTLMNVVSGPPDKPQAVLLRAGEPVIGQELMRKFRGTTPMKNWTNGPGKLAKALDVRMSYYGHHWSKEPLFIAPGQRDIEIEIGPRVGIQNTGEAVHYPYRFSEKGHPMVSKYR